MSLDRKILDRIEKEKIRIVPRWVFVLKRNISRLCVGIILIASSLAFSMDVFAVSSNGWLISKLAFFYVWLAVFLGLLIWGYYKLMQTEFDYVYKFRYAVIIPVVFVANIALGFIFYESGQTKKVDIMLERVPMYEKFLPSEKSIIENNDLVIKEERSESGGEDSNDQKSNQAQEDQNTINRATGDTEKKDDSQKNKSEEDASENEDTDTIRNVQKSEVSSSKDAVKSEVDNEKETEAVKKDASEDKDEEADDNKEDAKNTVDSKDSADDVKEEVKKTETIKHDSEEETDNSSEDD